MLSFLKVLIIVVTIEIGVAILTKPSDKTCYDKVKVALEAANHQVALYLSHNQKSGQKVISAISVKDKFLYKEIYFYELGATRKVAIGAFTRIFLISNPKKI